MAIERVIFSMASLEENNADVLDFIGTLPEGLTMDSNNQAFATLPGLTATAMYAMPSGNLLFSYGFRTSNGLMLTTRNSPASTIGCSLVITSSNDGTVAVMGLTRTSGSGSFGLKAFDLTNSTTTDYSTVSIQERDITSFKPVVLNNGTYTPNCYLCHEFQARFCGTIMVGGRSFAYNGLMALED